MQADILTTLILPISLFLIMFGLGLSLKTSDFKAIFTNPKAIYIGLTGQLLILPIVAFVIALLFQLPPELAVGLIIIALAPGGATSNMFTYLAKGDVSLSVSLTAIVSIVTPFTIPILAVLSMNYFMQDSTEFSIPVVKTIMQLLVITIIPIVIGMFVLAKWAKIATKLENILKYFSILFLLLIIVLIVLKNKDNMIEFFLQVGAATLVLNFSVLLIGYFMAKKAKLSQPQSVSIGYEVGIQNGTLALVVAGTLIGNNEMMIPAVTYSLIMFLTGAGFGWLVKERIKNTK
jgi:BASS family bile acid:Na+ symporter